jgi:hypothetical protein
LSLEDRAHAVEDAQAQLAEVRPAMVDRLRGDGAQDALRHGRGARDLEKVPAGGAGSVGGHGSVSGKASLAKMNNECKMQVKQIDGS